MTVGSKMRNGRARATQARFRTNIFLANGALEKSLTTFCPPLPSMLVLYPAKAVKAPRTPLPEEESEPLLFEPV